MEEVSYLNDFNDDSESDSECCEPKPKKRRTSYRNWSKKQDFSSPAEAEDFVTRKVIWKKCSSKNTTAGLRVEYHCTAGQYRRKECPAGLYLLYHSSSNSVLLYETECEHDNHVTDPIRELSNDMKLFIKEKFNEGIQKPDAILAVIRQKKLVEPPKSRIISYLKILREVKYGSPTVSAREISAWCEAHVQRPDDLDQPFVLSHYVLAESNNVEEQDLKVLMSTRRLLNILPTTDMVQIDATYKLNWQGYPVMVVGTSDRNNVFHPIAMAVCKGETANDFAFIFKALHNYNLEWQPSILLADCSEAITNGFKQVFGEPRVRIMCFFHVLKNIEKYFKVITKKKTCTQLKDDIQSLQGCKDEQTFQKAAELFLGKWATTNDRHVKDFVDYFNEQWLSKNSKWFEGAAVGYPSTNNGKESTNAVIKREHTLRERLPVGQFLNSVMELLMKWSSIRNPDATNCISFAKYPYISLRQWFVAYQWASQNKKVLKRKMENCTQFFTSSSSMKSSLTEELLSTFLAAEGKWETFDSFKEYYYGMWTLMIDEDDLTNCKCTCPIFFKNYCCKHSLGMQMS
ncbi:hypothetical protein V9T40_008571 [Parthenolecanium corni]|uniref:SWIM-type domain-containing protein n=1 Tax=Parthenolecanium corni TaxID=536013 RepID=A0AAN9Y880_9HEMI